MEKKQKSSSPPFIIILLALIVIAVALKGAGYLSTRENCDPFKGNRYSPARCLRFTSPKENIPKLDSLQVLARQASNQIKQPPCRDKKCAQAKFQSFDRLTNSIQSKAAELYNYAQQKGASVSCSTGLFQIYGVLPEDLEQNLPPTNFSAQEIKAQAKHQQDTLKQTIQDIDQAVLECHRHLL